MGKCLIHKIIAFSLCFALFNMEVSWPKIMLSPTGDGISKTITASPWVKLKLINTAEAAEFKPQKIDTVDYISLITMIALGIVAAGLVKSCKIGPNYEVYIFAGGALVYILGEIAVNASYKDIKDKTIQYNDSGKLTNAQEQALKDLKKSYEDIKNITQIKQMLQLAAAAAFLTAAGIATYKWIKEKAALKVCTGNIKINAAEVAKCTGGEMTDCGTCKSQVAMTCAQALMTQITGKLTYLEHLKINPAEAQVPSEVNCKELEVGTTEIKAAFSGHCALCKEKVHISDTTCNLKQVQDIANSVACNPATMAAKNEQKHFYDALLVKLGFKEKTPPKINPQIFDQIFSTFFPKAYADGMGAMLGLGAAGLGILAGLMINKSFWVDKLIPFPNRRAILFAAAAALAGTTALLTSNIKKKAQSNIDKIDKILKQYANYEAPATTDGDVINSGVGVTRSGNNVYGSAVNLGAGSKIDCMSTTSSGACANYNDLIANAQKESEANDSGEVEGISIDPAIMSATNALGDGINGVQGNSKISGETLGKFAQVAASQGAARSFLDNVRQKLNSVLKDNGEEEIDFAKQEQQAVKEMQDNVSKELQSRGVDLPSEVGKGTFGPSYQQELKDAKPSTAPVTAMAGSYHPKANVTKNAKRKVRDLVTGVHDGSALKDNTKVDDLNMGDTSINDEDGPSLFEILQHRHRQYWPILFQSSK